MLLPTDTSTNVFVCLGVERPSCVWCRTSPPSGRAGAGCYSRFKSPSRWSATMESSTPPAKPSPTPPNPGLDLTATPPGPFCDCTAPLHHHQNLHLHLHRSAKGKATGHTAVVIQACLCGHSSSCCVRERCGSKEAHRPVENCRRPQNSLNREERLKAETDNLKKETA